ncbi:DUF5787 family protein [Candidatus Halobonum tyrrellensis]|uniref:Uncharacterized protein n=1 Tax=Candidatus Halobonum tyrrellensis G22 TaxID=1324957 RepID=V4HIA8_9EURY|nr:DUF5787 family protein [Candidatus Halobonum tyrrellensis]ESP87654.1 hypothetical protein K933_13087 [Candidatus Halobonum tyrrellensis G22]
MYSGAGDSEFSFELSVCRWAELAWHPVAGDRPAVVARQLGTRERRWDTVVLEVDPGAFAARRRLGERGLDRDLLRVVRGAPADYEWYRDALDDPGFPWRYVREAVHRAADRGLVETRTGANGRVEFRRQPEDPPYPDWVERVVVVENKPDLDASAASALAGQLRHDVDAGFADEVWLATGATGRRVSPALLEDTPVEAGVLEFDFSAGVDAGAAEVVWGPARLDADADPDRRLELAERAYGTGWRDFRETMRPDCRSFSLRRAGRALLPHCGAKGRHQTAAECSGSCRQFAPEPPGWRVGGWPVEGGPGKGVRALLARRRERERDRAAADGGAGDAGESAAGRSD